MESHKRTNISLQQALKLLLLQDIAWYTQGNHINFEPIPQNALNIKTCVIKLTTGIIYVGIAWDMPDDDDMHIGLSSSALTTKSLMKMYPDLFKLEGNLQTFK